MLFDPKDSQLQINLFDGFQQRSKLGTAAGQKKKKTNFESPRVMPNRIKSDRDLSEDVAECTFRFPVHREPPSLNNTASATNQKIAACEGGMIIDTVIEERKESKLVDAATAQQLLKQGKAYFSSTGKIYNKRTKEALKEDFINRMREKVIRSSKVTGISFYTDALSSFISTKSPNAKPFRHRERSTDVRKGHKMLVAPPSNMDLVNITTEKPKQKSQLHVSMTGLGQKPHRGKLMLHDFPTRDEKNISSTKFLLSSMGQTEPDGIIAESSALSDTGAMTPSKRTRKNTQAPGNLKSIQNTTSYTQNSTYSINKPNEDIISEIKEIKEHSET